MHIESLKGGGKHQCPPSRFDTFERGSLRRKNPPILRIYYVLCICQDEKLLNLEAPFIMEFCLILRGAFKKSISLKRRNFLCA